MTPEEKRLVANALITIVLDAQESGSCHPIDIFGPDGFQHYPQEGHINDMKKLIVKLGFESFLLSLNSVQ